MPAYRKPVGAFRGRWVAAHRPAGQFIACATFHPDLRLSRQIALRNGNRDQIPALSIH
jgi:hypothetical protein